MRELIAAQREPIDLTEAELTSLIRHALDARRVQSNPPTREQWQAAASLPRAPYMTDTFRKAYRQLSEAEQEHVEQIKDAATTLELLIGRTQPHRTNTGGHRHIALALTKLEEAVFWAVKAAT